MLLLSTILIGFTALVVGIKISDLEPKLILPEAYESRQAQIADPENNAFEVWAEAVSMLPQPIDALWLPDPELQEVRYQTEPLSIGRMIYLDRPDDDPEFMAYLEAGRPAIAMTDAILEKPNFVSTTPIVSDFFYSPLNIKFYHFLPMFIGIARMDIEQHHNLESGLSLLEDYYALMKRLQDCLVDQMGYYGANQQYWFNYYETLQLEYRTVPSEDFRAALREMLASQGPPYEDMQAVLTTNFSILDETLMFPSAMEALGQPIYAGQKLRLFQLQSIAEYYRENVDRLRAIAELEPREFRSAIREPIWRRVLWDSHLGEEYTKNILWKLSAAHQINAMHDATRMSFALEDYRTAHGVYPDTTNDLIHDFMTELPVSPMTGEPFVYSTGNESYSLEDPEIVLFDVEKVSQNLRPTTYVEGDYFGIQPEEE